MTVASLWKSLDEAKCGEAVGEEDLIDPHRKTARVNPWTFNERQRRYQNIEDRPSLAVDLSIWVCESLTSSHMNDYNENPTLLLVFTRTMKLLSMGIKLIFVVEGKRRIRSSALNAAGEKQQDKFRRRRSGTSFWKACEKCETMLKMLGVPVVRAKAEGEALCALLNLQGIVDGVISNDGDCLLFGAKVVYTKFSLQNLKDGCIMRYDASTLRAVTDGNTTADGDENDQPNGSSHQDGNAHDNLMSLSRKDLVAFALLTGSDLAGDGLEKVGHRKAVRFIRKCKLDHPLSPETAAMDELESWARSVKPIVKVTTIDHDDDSTIAYDDDTNLQTKITKKKQTCCSRCSHAGSKRSHQKDGCEICGTAPGEPCFLVSADDKFRKSLRAKALALRDPKFDPTLVVNAYMRPNDNQMPASLLAAGMTSTKTLKMGFPRLRDIIAWPVVVKGHSLETSQNYLKETVAQLLARAGLFQNPAGAVGKSNPVSAATTGESRHHRRLCPRDQPIAKEITRKLVQKSIECYEVLWIMKATITNEDGDGIDGYEFLTVEPQDMITRQHPELVEAFQAAPKKVPKKQEGATETQKRREFLEMILLPPKEADTKELVRPEKNKDQRNFVLQAAKKYSGGGDPNNNIGRVRKKQLKKYRKTAGDDVAQLLRFANATDNKLAHEKSKYSESAEDYDFSSLESGSLATEAWLKEDEEAEDKPLSALKEIGPSQMTGGEPTFGKRKTSYRSLPLLRTEADECPNRSFQSLKLHGAPPVAEIFIKQCPSKLKGDKHKDRKKQRPPSEKNHRQPAPDSRSRHPPELEKPSRRSDAKRNQRTKKKTASVLPESGPLSRDKTRSRGELGNLVSTRNNKRHTSHRNNKRHTSAHDTECALEEKATREILSTLSGPYKSNHTNDIKQSKLDAHRGSVRNDPPAEARVERSPRDIKQCPRTLSKYSNGIDHVYVVSCDARNGDEVSTLGATPQQKIPGIATQKMDRHASSKQLQSHESDDRNSAKTYNFKAGHPRNEEKLCKSFDQMRTDDVLGTDRSMLKVGREKILGNERYRSMKRSTGPPFPFDYPESLEEHNRLSLSGERISQRRHREERYEGEEPCFNLQSDSRSLFRHDGNVHLPHNLRDAETTFLYSSNDEVADMATVQSFHEEASISSGTMFCTNAATRSRASHIECIGHSEEGGDCNLDYPTPNAGSHSSPSRYRDSTRHSRGLLKRDEKYAMKGEFSIDGRATEPSIQEFCSRDEQASTGRSRLHQLDDHLLDAGGHESRKRSRVRRSATLDYTMHGEHHMKGKSRRSFRGSERGKQSVYNDNQYPVAAYATESEFYRNTLVGDCIDDEAFHLERDHDTSLCGVGTHTEDCCEHHLEEGRQPYGCQCFSVTCSPPNKYQKQTKLDYREEQLDTDITGRHGRRDRHSHHTSKNFRRHSDYLIESEETYGEYEFDVSDKCGMEPHDDRIYQDDELDDSRHDYISTKKQVRFDELPSRTFSVQESSFADDPYNECNARQEDQYSQKTSFDEEELGAGPSCTLQQRLLENQKERMELETLRYEEMKQSSAMGGRR